MKKITTLLLLLVAALVVVMPTFADEELVDIYPYDDPGALYGPTTPFTLVGDSNWDMELLGHRYHFVFGGVRFAHQWTDGDADGIYAPTDYPELEWNAFAVMTINDGPDEIEMSTNSARTDITSVVHRIYSYFNENGELAMFEDHIFQYYIHNDGSDVTDNADWRLATEAEIDAFDAAADPEVDTPDTRYAHVRIIRDETDTDGYVLEPIGYLTWRNPDLDALPEEEQSLLVDWHPNNVVIPAGWSVVSFGNNDRVAYSATDFVKMLVPSFLEEETPKMNRVYTNQGLVFNNLASHDDDLETTGIQMIVDHLAEDFDLPNNITVTRVKMFDENGKTINDVEKLSYKVDIYESADYHSVEEDHVPTILETINFVYDADADTYTPDAALTVVDSSVFGAGYVAVYSVDHPEDGLVQREVSISVGVLPPRFENLVRRFVDEGVFVDLLGEVTANDGYGNDLTNAIEITTPAGFNMYNPKPGTYEIGLKFNHTVEVAGRIIPDVIKIGELDIETTRKNPDINASFSGHVTLYTEPFTYTHTGWAAFTVVHFDGEGKMVQSVSRTDWKMWNESGEEIGRAS